MSLRNKLKIMGLISREGLTSFLRRFRRNSSMNWLTPTPSPERLILAPHSLKSADPIIALDIYAGRYFLADQLVELNGRNPFTEDTPTNAWKQKLFSFEWLRHLFADQNSLTITNAQILISDWITAHGKPKKHIAWQVDVASYRLISWLYHSVPIVENSSPAFYKTWMKSIGVHIKYLRYTANETPLSIERLICRIALAYASICVSNQEVSLRNAASLLNEELKLQILDDGGHISRNPSVIPSILSLLLPLRESYAKLGKAPSQQLVSTIDRLMTALKYYRLGNGDIAHFNGTSKTLNDLVSSILRYDDSKGIAANHASASNYQRISNGDIILLCDTGASPKSALSKTSHAGTLSFEFSANKTPIIVNCGAHENANDKLSLAARFTAAHSTVSINDTSSSQIYTKKHKTLYGQIISGPNKIISTRENNDNFTTIKTSHNGYQSQFNTVHHRYLGVDKTGTQIIGEDKLLDPSGYPISAKRDCNFAVRFHLNPELSAGKTEDGKSILILGGNGIAWKFTCIDIIPELEESVFFAANNGIRKTKQIVLYGDAKQTSEIRWVFEKQLQERTPRKKKPKPQELPLD